MKASSIRVPISLLWSPRISPSAKVVWMVLQLEGDTRPSARVSMTRLAARAGVSRPTVYKAIRELKAAGWYPYSPPSPGGETRVQIPASLVTDKEIRASAKVFYGLLKLQQRQLRPHSMDTTLKFTYSFLARLTRWHRKTVAKAIRALASTGWLKVQRQNHKLPASCRFKEPRLAHSEAEVKRISRRLDKAPFRGEALMREFLSLLIDSDEFEDNASPGFLVNPLTDERLQLDRYYPPSVAFEYNGPQHYGPTDQFSAQEAVNQRTRDLIKIGLCATRGITLRIVHAQDLTLSRMREIVGNLLPLRDLTNEGPRIAFLQSTARSYRRRALANLFHTPRN